MKLGKDKRTRIYIRATCDFCGRERWLTRENIRPNRFTGLCNSCSASRPMEKHPRWKGGRRKAQHGYIGITVSPNHPFASMRNVKGEIYEHRLVMAQKLGRPLMRHEHVHHINGIRDDNRPENLELVSTQQNNVFRFMNKRIKQLEALLTEHNIPIPS